MPAGHESGAMHLGLFQVSMLHNIVLLAFGVVGLVLAGTATSARAFLIYGGAVGLVIDLDSSANFVPGNTAGNWLHLFLGLGMVALGYLLGRTSSAPGPSPTDSQPPVGKPLPVPP